jgi:hypothetical protein
VSFFVYHILVFSFGLWMGYLAFREKKPEGIYVMPLEENTPEGQAVYGAIEPEGIAAAMKNLGYGAVITDVDRAYVTTRRGRKRATVIVHVIAEEEPCK